MGRPLNINNPAHLYPPLRACDFSADPVDIPAVRNAISVLGEFGPCSCSVPQTIEIRVIPNKIGQSKPSSIFYVIYNKAD
jgi:hypothetical protein